MNMYIPHSAGLLGADIVSQLGRPIETKADAVEAVARLFDQGITSGRIKVDSPRRSDALAVDAAEIFYTTSLEQMLNTIMREPTTTRLMIPGPGQLLPVRSTLRPGQTDLVYDIETPTGQAAFIEPDAMRRLPQVGEFSERKKHRADWTGIGYGFGLIEMWQAAEKGGMPIDTSRASNARGTLDRFNERLLLYGDVTHEIPGLLANSHCYVQYMGTGFAAITDPDDAYLLLQLIEHHFERMAESYGGMITHVVAPKNDRYAMQLLRYGTDGEGAQFWAEALMAFPWLANVRWVDGLETAASTGGSLWQVWSEDGDELWTELSPTPMLFGPWTDQLRTSFALISHIGGVINRRPERMARYEFAAPA